MTLFDSLYESLLCMSLPLICTSHLPFHSIPLLQDELEQGGTVL